MYLLVHAVVQSAPHKACVALQSIGVWVVTRFKGPHGINQIFASSPVSSIKCQGFAPFKRFFS